MTDDNNNKPNHTTGMTMNCVYLQTTITKNPTLLRPHSEFTDGRQQQTNHNTTTCCAY